MAYVKRTWTDRDAENLGGRKITDNNTGTVSHVTVELEEGEIYEVGTPWTAAVMNDMEDRIEAGINEAGGGSDVVVTPVLTEGTTIANVTVDGVTVAIKETDYSNALILDVTSTGV